jgi:hypothetical protein
VTPVRCLRALPLVLLLAVPAAAFAQEAKSAALATQLTQLLDSKKLDTIAAKSADQYVGAIYIAGAELLVVSAKASVPAHEDVLLASKSYRDVYQDLFSSGDVKTRMFVTDLGADGLRFKTDTPDTVDVAGKTVSFDGEWGKAKISEADYRKTYTTSDEQYSQMLQTLIAAVKGS